MAVVSINTAEHYLWGDGCDGWHLVRTPTLSVIQERVPAHSQESRHYHRHAAQFFFVLVGTATLEIDGQRHQIAPHQGVHVAAGLAHQLRNEQAGELIFTVTSNPPSHGDRVNCG